MSNKLYFFDTTLRDGEQSPGASMSPDDKLKIAKQLEKLNIDIIEAGFAISSPAQFKAIEMIAAEIEKPIICSLARAIEKDIETAAKALSQAKRKRIHTFIATSPIHREFKLKKNKEEILKQAVNAVKYAKTFVNDVEFSAEDATRTELEYLAEVYTAVIEAGANVINVPDTVGYTVPGEFKRIIEYLKNNVKNIDKAIISVHCHNDLGLAVANSLSAIEAGARQVEVAINGIGERAGNASLEEIAMALTVRKDFFNIPIDINTTEIYKSSRMVVAITGLPVQPNKAIVGKNAFAHEAGIHQDGVLKERTTYEIMKPSQIGRPGSEIVLGRHSGKHGVLGRYRELGYELTPEELDKIYEKFTEIADKKKAVYDDELLVILAENTGIKIPDTYFIEHVQVISGTNCIPTATVILKKGDEKIMMSSTGNGPVDAIYKSIDNITKINTILEDYSISSISAGEDAMGEVSVTLLYNQRHYSGHASSTDIILASAKAYVNAINKIIYNTKKIND